MTYFTPGIDKYFANWILKDRWYTSQNIESYFYLFVFAIHKLSKDTKHFERDETDPAISHLPELLRKSKRNRYVYNRNRRTYDKDGFKDKLLRAINNNHPGFDEIYANRLATELTEKAMLILDALYYVENAGGVPNYHIRNNDKFLEMLK